ncbi:MAG: stage II sporulation protein M [Armatimonadota bacterium]
MPPARKADLNQFLARRQPGWKRLELLLQQAESQGLRSLSAPEVREFGVLYRRASSDLVTARAKTANAEILQYLNDLVARAYAQVYGSRRFQGRDLLTFLWIDFPRLFRHSWKYIALAALLFFGAAAFGWEVNRRDPTGSYYMLPPELVKQFPLLQQQWSDRTGHDIGPQEMTDQSTQIMLNNIAVGFLAFAGGLLLGLGTFYAMLYNGLMLGILGQAMSGPRTALVFWSLILPHGIIEITAICVMGGAGFLLASALLAPGGRTRRDALVERGRLAVLLVLGAAAMLVVAGLIEGFITPPAFIPPWAKLLFAALTAVGLVAYFGLAGRGPQPGLLRDFLAAEERRTALPEL